MTTILAEPPITAAVLIAAEADLIRRRGFAPHDAGEDILTARPTIITAACEVIAGRPCPPRDLTDTQACHLAEMLDHIEAGLGAPIPVWERVHAGDDAWTVAWRLDLVAKHLARELAVTA